MPFTGVPVGPVVLVKHEITTGDAVFVHLDHGIVLLDRKGTIRFANPAAFGSGDRWMATLAFAAFLHQTAAAFELWFDVDAPVVAMRRAFRLG